MEGRKKRSLILQVGRPELRAVIECLPETKGDNAFETVVATLDEHFGPQPDPVLAYQRLREARQKDNELIHEFYGRIKMMIIKC